MPRGRSVKKRKIAPDAIYDNVLIQRFINKIMKKGKKNKAEIIVYSALEKAGEKLKVAPLDVFEKIISTLTPSLEVKARRVGGATYQVPVEVSVLRGQAMAMKWLYDVCAEKKGKSMSDKLTVELVDAYNGTGNAIRKKDDLHKTAQANRAFAHFRW